MFYFIFNLASEGTSGLDIDLRAIDINQCPENPNEEDERQKEKNIFAGSDKCHNTSQKVREHNLFR